MVVDDDDLIRRLVVAVLDRRGSSGHRAGEGYHCVSASSGPEALALYREHRDNPDLPDIGLILMDWLLPMMTGVAVAKEIAALGGAPPVVFVTTKATQEDSLVALTVGVAVLIKPFTRSQILDVVAQHWTP